MNTYLSAQSTSPLGRIVEVFRPWGFTIIAGRILSAIFVSFGLMVFAFVMPKVMHSWRVAPPAEQNAWAWCGIIALWTALCGLVVGIGVCVFRYAESLKSQEVELFERGIRQNRNGEIKAVLWSDVAFVRETVLYQRPPVLKAPLIFLIPKVASHSYALILADETCLEFDGDMIKLIKRFARLLRERTERAGIPWEVVHEHAPIPF